MDASKASQARQVAQVGDLGLMESVVVNVLAEGAEAGAWSACSLRNGEQADSAGGRQRALMRMWRNEILPEWACRPT